VVQTKIPVAVLGATGSVGQKFIQLLENHPWFEVAELGASQRSEGSFYKDRVNWFLDSPVPDKIANLKIRECSPRFFTSPLVFSGLDASVAGEVETEFAKSGFAVVSNSRNHRMDDDVPLIIPEVNLDHLQLIDKQKTSGFIVTNPNCSTIGLVMALKPLVDCFGLKAVNVVTMQALSGAGYPGVSSLDILGNVVPFIGGEEEKMEIEPKKLLGSYNNGLVEFYDVEISAQCNRVAVLEGHLETVQVKLEKKVSINDVLKCFNSFNPEPQRLNLPFAPTKPICYFEEEAYPQPRLHCNFDKGMGVAIGRLRKDSLFDFKFVVMSHNTIRGAAGGAILCAELLKAKGYLKKI